MRNALSIALILLASGALGAEAPAPADPLRDHPSPYLAMHADDPVAWRLWGPEAFERAAEDGRLLLVSSGYFSCHWCHVMQQESFRDPDIAALLNRHFVPVKIDRELSPAVDAALMDFARHMRGQAGWPLNVFVTPEGYPLLATLYLPPEEFRRVATDLARRWRAEAGALTALARAAAEAVPAPAAEAAATPARDLRSALRDQALARADELQGGFGAQAKFPMAPQLLALLAEQARAPDAALGEFLHLTLEQMAGQALQDHLGGGFFRYTTDPDWHTPHFEKMLYDNALLVRVYLAGARVLDEPAFLEVARRTLDFVLDTLAAPGGGYYAALSAVDAAGVEGGFYLWDRAELQRAAGAHWPLARRYWGLDGPARFEAGHLPVPAVDPARLAAEFEMTPQAVAAALETVRTRLVAQRARRELPVDTQLIAAWNGLLLEALADAVAVFEAERDGGRYRRAAEDLDRFLRAHWFVDGRLVRARQDGQVLSAATLDDYAYVAAGLRRWQAVGDAARAETPALPALLRAAWTRFHDAGRWRRGEDALLRWGGSAGVLPDGPTQAPPAVLIGLSREFDLFREETAQALRAAHAWVQADPFGYASYVDLYP